MGRRVINDGETGLAVRTKLNGNYVELYAGLGYVVDASEADQGITGDGETIKAYVDEIGSDIATIILLSGDYTLTTNESIPDNITLEIVPGAEIDGAGTLTVFSIKADRNKIFGGTIIVTGLGKSYPEWWGVDGTADEIEIQAAIDATPGGIIILDSVNGYTFTSEGITVNDNSTHLWTYSINPTLFDTSADIYIVTVDDCINNQFTNIGARCTHATPTKGPVLMAGKAKNSHWHYPYLIGGKYGVLFDGAQGSDPGGIFYNEFHHSEIIDQTNKAIHFSDAAGMNENKFTGGLLSSTTTNEFIRVTGNNNSFTLLALEAAVGGDDYTQFAVVDNGLGNNFVLNRVETDGMGILVDGANSDESIGSRIYGNSWQTSTPIHVVVADGIAFSDTSGQNATWHGMLKGGPVLSTTVDASSSSGQKVVSLTSTTGLYEGGPIVLDRGNANEEWNIVDTITPGVSVTLLVNLTNTHGIGVAAIGYNQQSGMNVHNPNDASITEFFAQGKLVMKLDSLPIAAQNRTGLLVLDADQATVHQVYIGAADSAGSGFRTLRIPN